MWEICLWGGGLGGLQVSVLCSAVEISEGHLRAASMTHSWMNSLHPGYIISPDICPPSCILGHCLPGPWGVENGVPRWLPSQQGNVQGLQNTSHRLFKHTERITRSFWVCTHALTVRLWRDVWFLGAFIAKPWQFAREVTTWAMFLAFLPWVLVTSLIFRFLKKQRK